MGLSLDCVIDESKSFHWKCDGKSMKENINYIIRVTFRIFEILCRFLLFALIWVAGGGYIFAFFFDFNRFQCYYSHLS